jgi:AcrR family transcriptional regulator
MTLNTAVSPRERILQAALRLLERGGVEAVSTRAVSAAAEVQPPTIYRQFGDMQGLLSAVASAGMEAYLVSKVARPPVTDPVEELRESWNRHIAFGLAHPHLYTLMYSLPRSAKPSPALEQAAALLRARVQRVAEAGRLAVSVDRAVALIGAAGEGVARRQLGAEPSGAAQELDRTLPDLMHEAVLAAILVPDPASPGGAVRQRAAAHAVALVALLPQLPTAFSEAEQTLLVEWLQRLMESPAKS